MTPRHKIAFAVSGMTLIAFAVAVAPLLGGCPGATGIGLVSEASARAYCVENVLNSDSDALPDDVSGDQLADTLFDGIVYQLYFLRLAGGSRLQALGARLDSCSADAACRTCWSLMVDFAYGPNAPEFVANLARNAQDDFDSSDGASGPPPCQPLTGYEMCLLTGTCSGYCSD